MRPFQISPALPLFFAAALLGGCALTPPLVNTEASAPAPVQTAPLPDVVEDDLPLHEVGGPATPWLPGEHIVLNRLRTAEEIWGGTPYEFGGTSRYGIDCSAFVQRVFAEDFGVAISRSTETQVREGREVRRSELQPGDLVFFRTGRRQRHVGIYLREGEFLHASTSRGVTTDRLDGYYDRTYWTARRVLTPEQIAALPPVDLPAGAPPAVATSEPPRRPAAARRPASPPPPPPGARLSERSTSTTAPARRSGW